MKNLITITHLLFMVFIGLIIGGLIFNNSIWKVGLVLLIIDIVIGIALQYSFEKHYKTDDWNNLTFEEKRKIVHDDFEREKQALRNQGIDVDGELEKFCDEFNKEHKLGKYSKEESIAKKIECCEEMFNKADNILYSEYNDFLFGIDLNGNKRPLSTKHNELVRKVLDSEIDIATACYLSIDDIIVSPWQYLDKSIQNKITSIYGSLDPYSAFVFLNDYFYENYNYILVIYKGQTTHFAEKKEYRFSIY